MIATSTVSGRSLIRPTGGAHVAHCISNSRARQIERVSRRGGSIWPNRSRRGNGGNRASSSLPPIPTKVGSTNRQQPLSLGCTNWSSCPIPLKKSPNTSRRRNLDNIVSFADGQRLIYYEKMVFRHSICYPEVHCGVF